MAGLVFVVLLLAIAGHSSGATWCVCKEGNDAALQKTLDYACGAGSGTATATASDPSSTGCVYPSSASSAITTPSTTTTATPIGGSPYGTTPSTGVLGGVGNGLGPSGGVGINTDTSHGGLKLQKTSLFSFLMTLLFSGFMLLWG
uniref:Putative PLASMODESMATA CALLOSE-BINDING PROTEIN 3 n=1 Tax=Davidia involucrata TaxID=16924 RepID=A0A5B7BF38_DAVIN